MISMIKLYSDGENILTINTYFIDTKSTMFKLMEDMNKDQSNCSVIGNVLIVSTNGHFIEMDSAIYHTQQECQLACDRLNGVNHD